MVAPSGYLQAIRVCHSMALSSFMTCASVGIGYSPRTGRFYCLFHGKHGFRIYIYDFGEQHQDSASGDMHEGYGFASDIMMMPPCSAYNPHTVADNSRHQSSRHNDASAEYPGAKTIPRKTLIMTNPFANPAALEDLKRSFAEQPN